MSKNLLGGTNTKNFARGEPPPVGSWEYAGIAGMGKKPTTTTPAAPRKIPIMVATMSETIVIEKKPKKWKYLGIGAAVGALATYLGIKIRSY